jgi:hypothetical protein
LGLKMFSLPVLGSLLPQVFSKFYSNDRMRQNVTDWGTGV